MKKSNKKGALILGIGAALTYSFIKGNGIFNKPRFYNQHKALEKYLSSNHPDANKGDIIKTDDGYSTIINDRGVKIIVNMAKTPDGVYVFSEKPLD